MSKLPVAGGLRGDERDCGWVGKAVTRILGLPIRSSALRRRWTTVLWIPEEILDDFLVTAQLAHVPVERKAVQIQVLRRPHRPPSLPPGKTAVYVFSDRERVLKVGRVGAQSGARYTNQHYNGSAPSTLAGSLLADSDFAMRSGLTQENVSRWIKENTDRVNFLLDAGEGTLALRLLEAFAQCRLRPAYEGKAN